ncbi:MAG: S46 family peptidase [Planctomyces sp.]|nr:S46 family peptidase [Planctomyces sp.]
MSRNCLARLGVALLLWTTVGMAKADEGMWLFTSPPEGILRERHSFAIPEGWLDHLRESAVRFPGGSGSFVSKDGLVLTNHHVGADVVDQLSTAEKNYLKDGFYARTRDEELKCPDLELNVLASIEDVTARVNGSVPAEADLAAAQRARQAEINTIEKESQESTGLKSQVVTLYHGAQYHLYRYRRHTDVRLVFAPEQQIAFFGGDPDNFEYPRYCLDVCFFRVYENDQPLQVQHFLDWREDGVNDGELVFLVGHPGRTNRLNTVAHLEYLRDVNTPEFIDMIRRLEVALSAWANRSPENARRAQDDLFGIQNERKRRIGMLETLQDPAFMKAKRESERDLRAKVAGDPSLAASAAAWDEVAEATKAWRGLKREYNLYERAEGFQSRMFTFARQLVRYAEETAKPNAERLREYSDSALPSLKEGLTADVPIYPDLEAVKLRSSLVSWLSRAGFEEPLVVDVLDDKSPVDRAAQLISGSKLHDAAYRKQLLDGGAEAIQASQDPLIQLARLVDGRARQARKAYEQQVEERLRQAYAKIAAARLATGGNNVYPDATFSLRLAFGVVKGYQEGTATIPAFTEFRGLYERSELHSGKPPFDLPQRWVDARDRLDLSVPFNHVATLDLIGGNSGSPVVDREGRFVGIAFDSNIYGLANDTGYTDVQNRCVNVDARGIIEALRSVYDAQPLLEELLK